MLFSGAWTRAMWRRVQYKTGRADFLRAVVAFGVAAAQNRPASGQTSSREVDDEQDASSRGGCRRFPRHAASGSRGRRGCNERPGSVRQGEFPDFVQPGGAAAVRARGGDIAL